MGIYEKIFINSFLIIGWKYINEKLCVNSFQEKKESLKYHFLAGSYKIPSYLFLFVYKLISSFAKNQITIIFALHYISLQVFEFFRMDPIDH